MAVVHTPSLDGIDIEKALKHVLKPLGILVCGKTGVGKSSLIDSLTGKVNDRPTRRTVNETFVNLSDVHVRIWDSPGLQDGTVNEGKYLDEMYEKCQDVSIVLYCLDMTVVRWTDPEVKATQLLTERFGVDFWKKAILVLTKANMVRVPGKYKGEEGIYHKQLYENFVKRFRDQLIEQGAPEDIATNVCAVAAGYCDPDDETEEDRYIYYTSDKAKVSKENVQCDFLQELWISCLEKMSGVSRTQFSTITRDSTKFVPTSRVTVPTVVPMSEYHHRLVRRPRPTSAANSLIKTIICIITGGVTGAVVGYVLGPAGTVVGLVIGCAIGRLVSGCS